jgi:replicative DNA helicase
MTDEPPAEMIEAANQIKQRRAAKRAANASQKVADSPPANLAAERGLLSMAFALAQDAPDELCHLHAADFYEPRHRRLWNLAKQSAKTKRPIDFAAAITAAGNHIYLADLAFAEWPCCLNIAIADIQAAASCRRLMDAACKLAAAWSNDDRAAAAKHVKQLAREASAALAEQETL